MQTKSGTPRPAPAGGPQAPNGADPNTQPRGLANPGARTQQRAARAAQTVCAQDLCDLHFF